MRIHQSTKSTSINHYYLSFTKMIRFLFFTAGFYTILLSPLCSTCHATPVNKNLGIPSRIPGALLEFDFLRSDCLQGRFFRSNSSSSSEQQVDEITRQTGIASCLAYNGLSAGLSDTSPSSNHPAGVSAAPLTDLLAALESSAAMTFAFWILPPPQLPTQLVSGSLLSIKYDTSDSTCGFSLEIYEQAHVGSRQSAAVFCNSDGSSTQLADGVAYVTQQTFSTSFSGLQMKYLVISFEFSEQDYQALGTVYSVLSTSSSDADHSSVTPQTGHNINKGSMHPSAVQAISNSAPHLTLLAPEVEGSSGGDTSPWGGQLLHLALYPHLLSPAEITHNYQSGLLNSLPISWNLTVRLQEDELSNISLPVMDADNQLWHANYQLNCAEQAQNLSSTVNGTGYVCSKMYVRLLHLPALGELYVIRDDGSDPLLLKENDIIEYTSGSSSSGAVELTGPSESGNDHYVVHYRPPRHQHSIPSNAVMTSFSFEAVDGWTGEPMLGEEAMVSPVNDPPVAINNSAVLYARQCVVLPVLEGADAVDLIGVEEVNGTSSAATGSSHHSVAKAVVLTLPRNGTLHQVVSASVSTNGTNASSEMLSLELEPIPPPPPGGTDLKTPFTVGYCYLGLENAVRYTRPVGEQGPEGVVGTDLFTFGVVDSLNVSSSPAVMEVEVLSQLQPVSLSNAALLLGENYSYVMPVEASLCNLTLYGQVLLDEELIQQGQGSNASAEEVLTVRIEELPLHGTLVDLGTGQPLSRGGVLTSSRMHPLLYHMGFFHLTVGYKPNLDFFNTPNVSWTGAPLFNDTASQLDSISFSVVSISKTTQQIVAVSLPLKQPIEDVRNRNDPTEIEFSFQDEEDAARGYLEVYAWGFMTDEGSGVTSPRSGSGDPRHQRRVPAQTWRSDTNPPPLSSDTTQNTDYYSNGSASTYIVLNNAFKLTDRDKNTDLIRARVVSASTDGLITLNPEHLGGVDFNSDTYCRSSEKWTCRGDGYNDKVMDFLGTPANISRVLNGLQYLSLFPDHTDWVNVTLYDGASGDCLSASVLAHGRGSAISSYSSSGVQGEEEECFLTTVSVQIRVLGFITAPEEGDEDDDASGAGKWSLLVRMVGVSVVALCLLYCVCCYPIRKLVKCCKRNKTKRKKAALRIALTANKKARQQREEMRWKAVQRERREDDEETKRNECYDEEEIVYYERKNNDDNSSIQMAQNTQNRDSSTHEQEHCDKDTNTAFNLNIDNSCV